ncbi:MAG: hypothetical protein V3T31_10370 [candidate division Zixibacteria bacterium]
MSEQRKKILQMLADGKISTDDAERLLQALNNADAPSTESNEKSDSRSKPKFLCVKIKDESGAGSKSDNVDIKIPIMLLKAGMKLGSIVPKGTRSKFTSRLAEKGIDLDLEDLDSEKIECLIAALTESSINIDSEKETIRIFCA